MGLDRMSGWCSSNELPVTLTSLRSGSLPAVASVWIESIARPPSVALIDRRRWTPWGIAAIALIVLATEFGQTQKGAGTVAVHYLDMLIALGLFLPAVFGTARRGWVRRFLGDRS